MSKAAALLRLKIWRILDDEDRHKAKNGYYAADNCKKPKISKLINNHSGDKRNNNS